MSGAGAEDAAADPGAPGVTIVSPSGIASTKVSVMSSHALRFNLYRIEYIC